MEEEAVQNEGQTSAAPQQQEQAPQQQQQDPESQYYYTQYEDLKELVNRGTFTREQAQAAAMYYSYRNPPEDEQARQARLNYKLPTYDSTLIEDQAWNDLSAVLERLHQQGLIKDSRINNIIANKALNFKRSIEQKVQDYYDGDKKKKEAEAYGFLGRAMVDSSMSNDTLKYVIRSSYIDTEMDPQFRRGFEENLLNNYWFQAFMYRQGLANRSDQLDHVRLQSPDIKKEEILKIDNDYRAAVASGKMSMSEYKDKLRQGVVPAARMAKIFG